MSIFTVIYIKLISGKDFLQWLIYSSVIFYPNKRNYVTKVDIVGISVAFMMVSFILSSKIFCGFCLF